MFTGLVETLADTVALQKSASSAQLTLHVPALPAPAIGDSIAVNGACLTVEKVEGTHWTFHLLSETLARTNLGSLRPGDGVNIERSLAASARLGGHIVQGHVDTTSPVLRMEARGEDSLLEIKLPPDFAHYVVYKGSVCVNGVSLTIADVGTDFFRIWLIPHTRTVTNLGSLHPGAVVNLEFDLLAKYVERLAIPYLQKPLEEKK